MSTQKLNVLWLMVDQMRTDPGERRNRFGDPALADIVADLRDRLPPTLRRARVWRDPGADNPYFTLQLATVD